MRFSLRYSKVVSYLYHKLNHAYLRFCLAYSNFVYVVRNYYKFPCKHITYTETTYTSTDALDLYRHTYNLVCTKTLPSCGATHYTLVFMLAINDRYRIVITRSTQGDEHVRIVP